MSIIIFSKDNGETTTDKVMDWLFTSGKKDILRINGKDLISSDFSLEINSNCFEFKSQIIDHTKIKTIWFRRTYDENVFDILPFFKNYESDKNLELHLMGELGGIYRYFEYFFSKSHWINKYSQRLDKLNNICIAKKHGLKIPFTLVTNSKESIQKKSGFKKLVTKAIGEATTYSDDKEIFALFTSKIKFSNTDKNYFFPSKVQEEIEKKFELRIFYCDEKFYSMAIFSQNDKQTQLDFRNYNHQKPNRFVPYKLPVNIEKKLRKMIIELELATCSIDMIVDKDWEYYFLEINPVGQFGMVSSPCNYFLEKKLAKLLLKNCHEK
ncbi:grasp-with-spasm system ATP-grasp peptide maturase [Chryseobacterium sp. R2A-55]|uniref:grasp-with-spasm system ATP-grasp peptide maturase n=1 Tax=Chryseobacterium sp. R2A-55 TaxID=2744445 RepID=UPI001F37F704|nr:grasp-with-spasm system ATP-grasp peptide maturase [Chryseobacterium sp. R2A-55]